MNTLSLPTPVAWLRLSIEAWQRWRRRLEDRQLLGSMSPRELRDLGLGRDEIGYLTGRRTPARWAE